jgi:hypothetical protein
MLSVSLRASGGLVVMAAACRSGRRLADVGALSENFALTSVGVGSGDARGCYRTFLEALL